MKDTFSRSTRIAMRLPQHLTCLSSAVVAALGRRVSCTPAERRGYSPSPAFSLQPSAFSLSTTGLTLIELLSALTLLTMMVGLLAVVMNNAIDVWHSSRSRSRLIVQGRAALEIIGQDLRQAAGNTNLPIQVGNASQPTTYGTTNKSILFCRLLAKPTANQFAVEEVCYDVQTYSNRFVLGRWSQHLTIAPPQEAPQQTIVASTGPTNVLIDALASFVVRTNLPCVDVYLSLLDPDDARTAAGISDSLSQTTFVERHAVRMSRRLYLPAQPPGGLP